MRPDFSLYFDLEGKPIDAETWGRLYGSPERILGRDDAGEGRLVVTVWFGIDDAMSMGRKPPVIFGTALLWPIAGANTPGWPQHHIQEVEQYTTKDDAMAGHARWLAAVREGTVEPGEDLV